MSGLSPTSTSSTTGVFTKHGTVKFFQDLKDAALKRSGFPADLEFYQDQDYVETLTQLDEILNLEFGASKMGIYPFCREQHAKTTSDGGSKGTSPAKSTGAPTPSKGKSGSFGGTGAVKTPSKGQLTTALREEVEGLIPEDPEASADAHSLLTRIVSAVTSVVGFVNEEIWVEPFAPLCSPEEEQLVLFLKPEATGPNVDVRAVVRQVLGELERQESSVGAVRVLSGTYLEKHKIMEAHYGVIHRVAKVGLAELTDVAREALMRHFPEIQAQGVPVMGAYPFLEKHPQVSSLALATMNDSCGCKKLSSGMYAVKIQVPGVMPTVLLNAFHPQQLVPYYAPQSAIVVLEVRSTLPWVDLRASVCGSTDPEMAAVGSLRNIFYKNQANLGLPRVHPGANCVHMSAGPLEGLVEMRRFFTLPNMDVIPWNQLAFGQVLLQQGCTPVDVQMVAANPVLQGADHLGALAFDLTEDKQPVPAAQLLKGHFRLPDIQTIVRVYRRVTSLDSQVDQEWIVPYNSTLERWDTNHFVLFFKPEALALRVDLPGMLSLVLQLLDSNGVEVGGIRVLNAKFLAKHAIMAAHYGVINQVSVHGVDALSDVAKAALHLHFGERISTTGAPVLGGHQFMSRFGDQISAEALQRHSDTYGSTKLSGGAYALWLNEIPNQPPCVVLNAFHPQQLVHFTLAGHGILALECWSKRTWADLRRRVCGATDPTRAMEGSLRATFLEKRTELNIADVSSGSNCIHMSAGPLEAMLELQRFFGAPSGSVSTSATGFGQALERGGLAESNLKLLCSNQSFPDLQGKMIPVFDLTEELDCEPAVKLVKGLFSRPSVERLLESYNRAILNGSLSHEEWIVRYNPLLSKEAVNQFVFFFKPEALGKDVRQGRVLELALNILESNGVEIGAARVMNGPFLAEKEIMAKHYGVINQVSRGGLAALSDSARTKLNEAFKDALAGGAKVLGGHEFLASQSEFTSSALQMLNDQLGTTKLAGGTYALFLNDVPNAGGPCIVLNAFHPAQLEVFTGAGAGILVLECWSTQKWRDLRLKICGATDPTKAAPGSIRASYLVQMDDLMLPRVSSGANCVHMSAGPLEGMVELQRFFSPEAEKGTGVIPFAQTGFGQGMRRTGISDFNVKLLATNPTFYDDSGKRVSVFDMTEERDHGEAAVLLKNLFRGPSVEKLVKSLHQVSDPDSSLGDVWVTPYDISRDRSGMHQFLLFLKPELTSASQDLRGLLELVLNTLYNSGVEVGAVRAVGGRFLDRRNIMVYHYASLNQVAREGASALSVHARSKLYSEFSVELSQGAQVLGAYQFLTRFPHISSFALSVLHFSGGWRQVSREGFGTVVRVPGSGVFIVLNAFHPQQITSYLAPTCSLLVLECLTRRPWAEVRTLVCGAMDPAQAAEGSLRQRCLLSQAKFGIPIRLNTVQNGVHASASPLEAMVELQRFFDSDDGRVEFHDTEFGKALLALNKDANLPFLASNPALVTPEGFTDFAYTLVDAMNAPDAAKTLLQCIL